VTKRERLERAITKAVRDFGGESNVSGDDNEPVASVRYGRDGWLDVYVRVSQP